MADVNPKVNSLYPLVVPVSAPFGAYLGYTERAPAQLVIPAEHMFWDELLKLDHNFVTYDYNLSKESDWPGALRALRLVTQREQERGFVLAYLVLIHFAFVVLNSFLVVHNLVVAQVVPWQLTLFVQAHTISVGPHSFSSRGHKLSAHQLHSEPSLFSPLATWPLTSYCCDETAITSPRTVCTSA